MKHIKTLTFLLIALFSAANSYAQIFYKIEGNGLKNPSYLFGTHHLAPLSIINSYPSLISAFNTTDAVVGEIDMTIPEMQLAMSMQKYLAAPADSTISKLLSAEEYSELNEKFKPYSPMPGVDLKHLDAIRPMGIATMVTMKMMQQSFPEFNVTEQLDASFQKHYKSIGKEVIPLETPEMQAQLLYTFIPIEKQIQDLKELLDNPEELKDNCEKLNRAYLAGDLDTLLELTESEESDPAFTMALLTMRNRDWMKKLPDIIKAQPVLITVGALHLAGPEGIPARLRELGYSVTPLK